MWPLVKTELLAYREECVWVLLVLGTDIRSAWPLAFSGRLRIHRRRVDRLRPTVAMATRRSPSSPGQVVCRWRARMCPPGVQWHWPLAAELIGRQPPSPLSSVGCRPVVRYYKQLRTAKPSLLPRRWFGFRRSVAATGRYPAAYYCMLVVRVTLWRLTTETNLSAEQHVIITRYAQVDIQKIFNIKWHHVGCATYAGGTVGGDGAIRLD